jgi:hypothetical protein
VPYSTSEGCKEERAMSHAKRENERGHELNAHAYVFASWTFDGQEVEDMTRVAVSAYLRKIHGS